MSIGQQVPASKKLSEKEARELLKSASKLHVAKGKKLSEFAGGAKPGADAVAAVLGPTGNLRAPTIRVGRTMLVGFDPEMYAEVLG